MVIDNNMVTWILTSACLVHVHALVHLHCRYLLRYLSAPRYQISADIWTCTHHPIHMWIDASNEKSPVVPNTHQCICGHVRSCEQAESPKLAPKHLPNANHHLNHNLDLLLYQHTRCFPQVRSRRMRAMLTSHRGQCDVIGRPLHI
jgi:hypothetical protein